jgi:hypothetical protein
MESQVNLSELGTMAATVASQHAEYEAAVAAEEEADAALLTALVETVRPALRALSSRPQAYYHCWWVSNVKTDTETRRAEWRGVYMRAVSDSPSGPEKDHPSANSGQWVGGDLFLREDGTWVRLVYSGTWSKWQGAADKWEAEEEALTALEVAQEYKVADIVESVRAALQAQLDGAKSARTKAARERAARVAALAALVGG